MELKGKRNVSPLGSASPSLLTGSAYTSNSFIDVSVSREITILSGDDRELYKCILEGKMK